MPASRPERRPRRSPAGGKGGRGDALPETGSLPGPALDVLVVGDYCLDLVFAGLPEFLQLGKEIVAADFAMTPGGSYNSAVALHRLGLRVGWAADFGDDDFSRFVLEHVRREGLDPGLFVHHRRPLRRITVAASLPQDRAFLAFYDQDPPVPAGARALARVRPRLALIPGFFSGPLLRAGARWARARSIELFMDANSNRPLSLADRSVREALRCPDVFLANQLEAAQLTGFADPASAALRLGELSPVVVVKAGQAGAYGCRQGSACHDPAIPVSPLDTTGAGDCFNAGFIRAWLDGRPLAECLRWGNIVGGLSTLGMGGTGKVVDLDLVQRWLSG